MVYFIGFRGTVVLNSIVFFSIAIGFFTVGFCRIDFLYGRIVDS